LEHNGLSGTVQGRTSRQLETKALEAKAIDEPGTIRRL
jgi:hypothetical protein